MSTVQRETLLAVGVALVFGAVFLLGEMVRRRFPSKPEVSRKTVHLLSGIVALSFPWVFRSSLTVLCLAIGFVAIGLITKRKGLLQCVHGVARASSGTIYFPLAVALIFMLSGDRPVLYFTAILVMAVADALAALVGGAYGRITFDVEGNVKSLEGSATFFAATWLCIALPLTLMTGLGWLECGLIALVIAVLVTGFEAISLSGSDNIFVPFGTYYLLAKMTRLPLTIIVENTLSLLLIILLTALIMVRLRLLTPSGVIGIMLLNYAAISLCGYSWFLPLMLSQVMYYAMIVHFIRHEGREKVKSFQLNVVLYLALIPTLLMFTANTVRDVRSVYLEYLTSITAQLAIIGNYFFAKAFSRSSGTLPGWVRGHRRLLEGVSVTAAAAGIAALPILWWVPTSRWVAFVLVLSGTWMGYALNVIMNLSYRGVKDEMFEHRRRFVSTVVGVAFVWLLRRLASA